MRVRFHTTIGRRWAALSFGGGHAAGVNGDGEVWDFSTAQVRVDASRTVTLRVRLSRFRNRLRLEPAEG